MEIQTTIIQNNNKIIISTIRKILGVFRRTRILRKKYPNNYLPINLKLSDVEIRLYLILVNYLNKKLLPIKFYQLNYIK